MGSNSRVGSTPTRATKNWLIMKTIKVVASSKFISLIKRMEEEKKIRFEKLFEKIKKEKWKK